jgi:hypothetical protein
LDWGIESKMGGANSHQASGGGTSGSARKNATGEQADAHNLELADLSKAVEGHQVRQ